MPQLGVQFHCTWAFYTDLERAAVLDRLAAAGVKWLRIDMGWAAFEERGRHLLSPWYVDLADRCVNMANSRGMKVLAMLHMTPSWASDGGATSAPPTDMADFAWIAGWAADHFRGRVGAWQIWNEPNPLQSFWTGSVGQYVQLLQAAYPAIKAADPSVPVVLGGPSTNDAEWIRQVYALGAKPYFDVLATQPYQGLADAPPDYPDDGNTWWFTHLPAVRNVMIAYDDGATPVWFTEFGWSSHENPPDVQPWARGVTPEVQAQFLVEAVRYTQEHYPYVTHMFWYKERARPGAPDPHQEGYALLNSDLSEKPAYQALRSLLTP